MIKNRDTSSEELQFDGWQINDLPGDTVLVLLDNEDKDGWMKRKTGVYVPSFVGEERDSETFRVARVLACGDKCENWIKEADLLVFSSVQLQSTRCRAFKTEKGDVVLMSQGIFLAAVEEIEPKDD